MRVPLLALTFGFVISSLALASTKLTLPSYVAGTCIHDPLDPFEPNVRVISGPMKDLCVNPLQRRSGHVLSPSEAAPYFQEKPGHIVIANFSHLGEFWIAQIPVQKAEKMILQVEYFPVGPLKLVEIAHTQLRIDFESDVRIEMVSQSQAQGRKTAQLKRLIFSVENIGPYGEKFDALKGLKGHYNVAYRFVSLDDKYKWMVTEQGHTVTQHLLKMTSEQVRTFLLRALQEAQSWSTRRSYHTLEPNCVTELFVLLDEALGIRGEMYPQIPNFAPAFLKRRGLIDSTSAYPTLNEEYGTLN